MDLGGVVGGRDGGFVGLESAGEEGVGVVIGVGGGWVGEDVGCGNGGDEEVRFVRCGRGWGGGCWKHCAWYYGLLRWWWYL